MNRRHFLQTLALSAAGGALPMRLYAQPEAYAGRLLLVLQAAGGWDVSSFCDPKMNVPGEPEITHWSRILETRREGNIPYAPYAKNVSFFERHHKDMLVINGVDAQTNSHTTGEVHSWSGRNAVGYPTLTGLFAAHHAPGIPLSYISTANFADGGRLVRNNRLYDAGGLINLLQPNVDPYERVLPIRLESEVTRIREYRRQRLLRMLDQPDLLPRQRFNLESQLSAEAGRELLQRLLEILPPEEEFPAPEEISREETSNARQQVQLALLAFKAGVASAVDIGLGGYDTHSEHDALHTPLLAHLADVVDFLWNYAEQQGVAHRVTLLIGSEFSRTPYYNSHEGKDHWPIGSFIVMEKDAPWGNRVVGLTDEAQNAYNINPDTLQRDDANGTIIYPKHIHKALRRYLGLENTAVDANFQFADTEDFDFFNPSKSTV